MAQPPTQPALRLATWLYSLCLVAYPPEFRREYGPHMRQLFRDSCREAEQREGAPGLARLWLNTLGDLIATSFVERISERGYWDMSYFKSPVWGGAAAIGGGVLWALWGFAPWLVPLLMLAVVCLAVAFISLRAQLAALAGGLGQAGATAVIGGAVLVLLGSGVLLFGAGIGGWVTEDTLVHTVENIIFVGLAAIALSWLIAGGGALKVAALGRWRAMPLAIGVLMVAQFMYGWLFIFDAPDPTISTAGPWFALGILMGAASIGLGLGLLASRTAGAAVGGAQPD